ncbi:MAG: mobile mystery protein A [Burkholderiaceae bacterium]|nr:mobile mystery protein A [Burkholderiaceae bacterium]
MSSEFNKLRLEQIQVAVQSYATLRGRQAPRRGWLKEIREALGRTERQQAARIGVTGPTLHKSERAEADERISIGQLRRLADALDCDLVYALVPRKPLTQIVEDQATSVARAEVMGVAHTMSLESQRPTDDRLGKQISRRAEQLLNGRWSALWK